MLSARKLFAIFLLGQTAFAAAVPNGLTRRDDVSALEVAAPFQASAPLVVRAPPPGSPGGRPGSPPPGGHTPPRPNPNPPRALARRLGARKPGDSVPDAKPKTIGEMQYKDTTTPPDSPETPVLSGALEQIKERAPAGSEMKSMNLKGYNKILVRGAGNEADDTPMLNVFSDTKTDMHVIVENKDKSVDSTPAGRRLPFSEVLGQTVDKQFDGNLGGKLQRLTQYHVANPESEALMEKLWVNLKKDGNKADVPRDLADDSAWSQLAQSANGGALFRYSNDHYKRLQGWQPVRAEVYREPLEGVPGVNFWHLTWVYGPQP